MAIIRSRNHSVIYLFNYFFLKENNIVINKSFYLFKNIKEREYIVY